MELSEHGILSNAELKWIQQRLRKVRRLDDNAESRWDLNLAEGMVREELARRLLLGRGARLSVEVKSDFIVDQSGNVAIEYRHENRPSGIAVSRSLYWWIFFSGKWYQDEVSVVILTERLKSLARYYYQQERIMKGGQRQTTEFVLLPKLELLEIGR